MKKVENSLYRVNCGSAEPYKDAQNQTWLADQEYARGKQWGAVEGKTATREKDLPIWAEQDGQLYRSERYAAAAYVFHVPQGTYRIRIHLCEAFEGNFRAGMRVFGIRAQGHTIIENADPYALGGGFARPVIVECAGIRVEEPPLRIDLLGATNAVCAIEVLECVELSVSTRIIPVSSRCRDVTAETGTQLRARAKQYRVLFVGNSGTFFWAIPETVAHLVETGQDEVRVVPEQITVGGAPFSAHSNNQQTMERIRGGKYDYVVFQGQSMEMLNSKADAFVHAERLVAAIREGGATPVLYAYSGPKATSYEDRQKILDAYRELGRKLNVFVVPSVGALNEAMRQRPGLNYHNPDQVHMGMYGAYIMSIGFYAYFTGRSAATHPCPTVLEGQVPIDPEIACFLGTVVEKELKRIR